MIDGLLGKVDNLLYDKVWITGSGNGYDKQYSIRSFQLYFSSLHLQVRHLRANPMPRSLTKGWVEVTLHQDGKMLANAMVQVITDWQESAYGETGDDGLVMFPMSRGKPFSIETAGASVRSDSSVQSDTVSRRS